MINKNYLIFAAAIALASCSVDEYMGENPEFTQTTKENIIGFGGGTGSMSRATQNTGTTAQMLDYQFKVYGWKTTTTGTQKVFDNYWVWYSTTTTSNPDATDGPDYGWEYVGDAGTEMPFEYPDPNNPNTTTKELKNNQYIKYWDYSATNYKFVAGSPINQIEFKPSTVTNSDQNAIATAEVTGLAGHISPTGSATSKSQNPVYISAPIKITKNSTPTKYGDAVQLKFTRLQTKVRVGIYETIPGYSIKSIEFYKYDGSSASSDKFTKDNTNIRNVILTSATSNYFNGGAKVKANVTYNWGNESTAPSYTVSYTKEDDGNNNDYVNDQNWYGGKFENGIPAISSNPSQTSTGSSTKTEIIKELYGEDTDMDAETGYFTVLSTTAPTPSALVIKCDFTLKAEDTNETITVTGATAAIPAAYCKWDDNKMYTYIFKISQETNGTTGTTDDKSGLFPITFDAEAIATDEGVETIVQTPSITTHQQGAAVTANGIEYKTGAAIDIIVTDDSGSPKTDLQTGTKDSQGYIAVYDLGAEDENAKTEAELTVTAPSSSNLTLTLSPEADTNKSKATFNPSVAGYYAIQYCSDGSKKPVVYKYKVIKVVDPSSGS